MISQYNNFLVQFAKTNCAHNKSAKYTLTGAGTSILGLKVPQKSLCSKYKPSQYVRCQFYLTWNQLGSIIAFTCCKGTFGNCAFIVGEDHLFSEKSRKIVLSTGRTNFLSRLETSMRCSNINVVTYNDVFDIFVKIQNNDFM